MYSCLGSQVGSGTLAELKVPRPSFKATNYSEYGELPLDKAFAILPGETVGVCVVTNSSEGIVVREGQALRSRGAAVKCLKEYVVPGPQSSSETKVEGGLSLAVAYLYLCLSTHMYVYRYLSIYPYKPLSAQVEGGSARLYLHPCPSLSMYISISVRIPIYTYIRTGGGRTQPCCSIVDHQPRPPLHRGVGAQSHWQFRWRPHILLPCILMDTPPRWMYTRNNWTSAASHPPDLHLDLFPRVHVQSHKPFHTHTHTHTHCVCKSTAPAAPSNVQSKAASHITCTGSTVIIRPPHQLNL